METPINVLITDDHAIVRTGIAGMLANVNDVQVVGQAGNGQEAIQFIADNAVDVVLMDLRMPVMDGPTAISAIRHSHSDIGILVLTTYDTDADILRAIEAGAHGYMMKDTSREELVAAIRATRARTPWLAPQATATVMKHMQQPGTEKLSERELEVLRLVAKGHSNKEIAAEIYVSQATVKTHLIHIFRKLDVNDRTGAVTAAMKRGIIPAP